MPNIRTAWATDPLYLKAAFSKLDLSEIKGPKHDKQVLAMYVASGHPEIIEDEVPWCAAFVGWALVKGNLPNTGSLLAISYAKYGAALDKREIIPRGAIGVTKRVGGNHVFFVLNDDGRNITRIGGNQENGKGGGVTISTCRKSDVIAFRMPIAAHDADEPQPASDGLGAKVARVVGLGTASTAAVTQIASDAVGPAVSHIEKVKEVVNNSGDIVDVSKQVVQIAPDGFWPHVLATVQSPKFLAAALIVVLIAWGLTYYLRKRKEQF